MIEQEAKCWRALKALHKRSSCILFDQGLTIPYDFAELGEPELVLKAADALLGPEWDTVPA